MTGSRALAEELLCSSAPDVSVASVVQLLTGPNSSDMAMRHVAAVQRLCRHASEGFSINDVEKLTSILKITSSAAMRGQDMFCEPLQHLLECALQFRCHAADMAVCVYRLWKSRPAVRLA